MADTGCDAFRIVQSVTRFCVGNAALLWGYVHESINLCRYRRLTLLTLVSRDSVPIPAVFSCKIRHPETLESFKLEMAK